LGIRIVFEFLGHAEGEEWLRARRVLEEAGAQAISTAAGLPPGTYTAVLPDKADVDGVLDRLRNVPGVGRAEPDAPRETFGTT
jgi:hypothetical protein